MKNKRGKQFPHTNDPQRPELIPLFSFYFLYQQKSKNIRSFKKLNEDHITWISNKLHVSQNLMLTKNAK